LVFLAIQTLLQTIWFYLGWRLDMTSDISTFIGTVGIMQGMAWLIPAETEESEETAAWPKLPEILKSVGLSILGIALTASVLIPASKVATGASIRTPWPLLPSGTLVAIAALWGLVLLSTWLRLRPIMSAVLSGLALLATSAIATLIYRLGFGFDGFLHVASEKILLQTGTLTPAPPYYMGQYVFTTWLSRVTDISIASIDRWLVPIACAILLPFAAYVMRDESRDRWSLFPFFLLPLAPFVATTPQSFAYLLGLCGLLIAMGQRTIKWLVALILGAWSIAVHPLAGVPFFLITLAILFVSGESTFPRVWIRRVLAILFTVGSAVAIPVLFFMFSLQGKTDLQWNFSALFSRAPWVSLWQSLMPYQQNFFVLWPAWSSLIMQALPFILLLCALFSLRKATADQRWPLICLILGAVLLAMSSALLKAAGDFAFLIDYERGNYADRLLVIATFCLLPAAAPWISFKLKDLRQASPTLAIAGLVAVMTFGGALAYNALPRHDALVTGRGWSVSGSDLEAVRFIDRDAQGKAYGALANQSVSAAAVSQLGFKRYAPGDVFFYPIPTGGPLYELYLKLTYDEVTLDIVKDAATLTKSERMYVVINDYWWNADQLVETLGAIAQDQWTFGDADKGMGNVVHVFKFEMK